MPPSLSSQERLRQGHALQMQGKLAEASTVYREVLVAEPRNAPALHLLGVLAMQTGQVEQGVGLIREAVAILPGFAPAHDNLGKGLEQLGRKEEALASFGRVIALAPGFAAGHAHRARILESLGRFDEALRDYDKAMALKNDPELMLNRGAVLLQLGRPEEALAAFDRTFGLGLVHPLVHFNRGVALAALRRADEALASYDRALTLKPDYADAYVNRGLMLEDLKRQDEALASYERALALAPELQAARINRAALLARLERKAEALAAYDAAIAAAPDDAFAYNNRGSTLKGLGELDRALADFDRAIALRPRDPALLANRAAALQALGRFDEALRGFDDALDLEPNGDARTELHKAMLLLLLGRFQQGLPLYEHRERAGAPLDPARAWRGPAQSVAGKSVLVQAEQGLGDVILFSRYLSLLQALGAAVMFAVPSGLRRLLGGLDPAVILTAAEAPPPPFDFHVALGSLPLLFGTTMETIPGHSPYLAPEPDRVARWRAHLGGKDFRVGVAWQGKTRGINDPFRSFPLAALAPLANLPGVRLISLQKGEGSEQLKDLPAGMAVEGLGEDFDGGPDAFIDTAAAMASLDLVISCDTSVAHLAGALGRPVWVALKNVPEWRWQLDRSDSPWYPTMTLFRQPAPGDWAAVFAAMADRLQAAMTAEERP